MSFVYTNIILNLASDTYAVDSTIHPHQKSIRDCTINAKRTRQQTLSFPFISVIELTCNSLFAHTVPTSEAANQSTKQSINQHTSGCFLYEFVCCSSSRHRQQHSSPSSTKATIVNIVFLLLIIVLPVV